MSKLIKGSISQGGTLVEDSAHPVATEDELDAALDHCSADSVLLLPLALWQSQRAKLVAAAGSGRPIRFGLQLAPTDDPAAVAADVENFTIIAVEFPKFGDGRGFSIGRLLRERYGYAGELRAVGEVMRDQMFFMLRCGFDAFLLAASKSSDRDVENALTAYEDFSVTYQASVEQKLPLFRRRMVGATDPAAK
jgi:uncharacterized protein (DUF934 family)